MLTKLALGRSRDAMLEGQLPPEKPQEEPNPGLVGRWLSAVFCGSLIETRPLREDKMSRTIYKVARRLAPALTVVYRAMQIVRLLINC